MLDKIKTVLPGTNNKSPAGPVDEKAVDTTTTVTQQTTPSDIEKARGGESSSDGEVIDGPDPQAGVQEIEAALTVWTKWHLVAAYGMYVYCGSGLVDTSYMPMKRVLTNAKDLVDLLHHLHRGSRRPHLLALRHQLLLVPLAHGHHVHHVQHHRRPDQAAAVQDP